MELPMIGEEIVSAALDGAYSVFISTKEDSEMRIEGEFDLRTSAAVYSVDPQLSVKGPHLDQLAALVGRRIVEAVAEEGTGGLRVRCDGGVEVLVPADPQGLYEAWSVSPGRGPTVFATPDGKLG